MKSLILVLGFLVSCPGQSFGSPQAVEYTSAVEEKVEDKMVNKVPEKAEEGLVDKSTDKFAAKSGGGKLRDKLGDKAGDKLGDKLGDKNDFDEAQINYKTADEESLPILTKAKSKAEEQSGTLYKTVSSIFLVLLMGALGLWYLKKKSLMGKSNPGAMQIKVLTQYHLGPRRTLAVVRVAGESLLIGFTENQITLLKPLSLLDEDLPDTTPKNFKQTIAESDAVASSDAPPKNTILKSSEFADTDEEFSFGNIKHLVENKLKGMKRW